LRHHVAVRSPGRAYEQMTILTGGTSTAHFRRRCAHSLASVRACDRYGSSTDWKGSDMNISAIFAMGSAYDGYNSSKFKRFRRTNYDGFDSDRGYFYEDHNGDYYYYNGYNSFYSGTRCCD
jgi:hypothetical protein